MTKQSHKISGIASSRTTGLAMTGNIAAVAELADALDSKSSGAHTPYRFDSDQRHNKLFFIAEPVSVRLSRLAGQAFSGTNVCVSSHKIDERNKIFIKL